MKLSPISNVCALSVSLEAELRIPEGLVASELNQDRSQFLKRVAFMKACPCCGGQIDTALPGKFKY